MTVCDDTKEDWYNTETNDSVSLEQNLEQDSNFFYDLKTTTPLSPLPDPDDYEDMDIVTEEEQARIDANLKLLGIKSEQVEEELPREDIPEKPTKPKVRGKTKAKSKDKVVKLRKILKKGTEKETPRRSLTYLEMVAKVEKEKLELEKKQEEIKQVVPHLDTRLPDINDPNFNCCVCQKTFTGRYTYGFHLIQVHNIPDGVVFHQDIQSNHPELAHMKVILYCPNCNENFTSYNTYKYHLSTFHTSQSPLVGRTNTNPYMLPDIHDKKFFCRICQDSFNTKTTYQCHLICVHSMDRQSVFAKPKESTPEVQRTCTTCHKCFHTTKDYEDHQLQYPAKSPCQPVKKRIPQPDLLPIKDDPDFYCRTCDYTYKHSKGYSLHLKTRHNIPRPRSPSPKAPSPPPTLPGRSPSLSPVVIIRTRKRTAKDNYCVDCFRTFASQASYRRHMKQVHKVK